MAQVLVMVTAAEIKFKNKVNYVFVLYASQVTEYFDVILMRCNTHKHRSQIEVKNNLLNFFKCSAIVGAAF